MQELKRDQALTPTKFASYFSKFEYHFRAKVQDPEVFLATRSGDCDDYAILAAEVLRERGYTPRLVSVRMKKMVHVVCYVEEDGSFLDYNYRMTAQPCIQSDGSLKDMADKVAAHFGEPWTSVSEFTYEQRAKRLVRTELPPKENVWAAVKGAVFGGR